MSYCIIHHDPRMHSALSWRDRYSPQTQLQKKTRQVEQIATQLKSRLTNKQVETDIAANLYETIRLLFSRR